jgi:hypothetical protein
MTSLSSGGPSARRRAMQAVGAVLLVWALTVLPHHGEFWPFSIYPMFARAGQSWTNALVIEVDPQGPHGATPWGPWRLDQLPGAIYPAKVAGVSALDLAQMVKLTSEWTDDRVGLYRKLFARALLDGRSLLLVRADGHLSGTGAAEVELTGLLLLEPDGHTLNPQLRAAR